MPRRDSWLVRLLGLQPPRTGLEELIGAEGEVVAALAPEGTVMVHGEYWDAVAPAPIPEGDRVQVVAIHGLKLAVEAVGRAHGGLS